MKISKIRLITISFIIIFVISLIPIFLLGKYAIPYYDDFNHGAILYKSLNSNLSLIEILKNTLNYTINIYNTWQGAYTGIFLSVFMPGAWGIEYYYWTPIILISSLIIGETYFCHAVFKKIFKINNIKFILISLCITFFAIQNLPSAKEGFYWWAGGIMHTFPFALLLIVWGLTLQLIKSKNILLLLSNVLLILIVAGGGHQIALLQFTSLLSLGFFLKISKSNYFINYDLYIITFLSFIGFIINALAPGNLVRMGTSTPLIYNLILSIIKSFISAIVYGIQWTNLNLLLVLFLVFILVFPNINKVNKIKVHPLLFSAITFCVYSSAFSLGIFGYGTVSVAARYVNTLFWTFWWFAIVNFLYCIQYYRNSKILINFYELINIINKKLSLITCTLIFFISISCSMIHIGFSDSTTTCALSDLLLPSTKQFHETSKIIFHNLETNDQFVSIPLFNQSVRLLPSDNFSEQEKQEILKKYYNKKNIVIEKGEYNDNN